LGVAVGVVEPRPPKPPPPSENEGGLVGVAVGVLEGDDDGGASEKKPDDFAAGLDGVAADGSAPQSKLAAGDGALPVLGLSATAELCARDDEWRPEPRETGESPVEMLVATGCANANDGMALNVRAGGPAAAVDVACAKLGAAPNDGAAGAGAGAAAGAAGLSANVGADVEVGVDEPGPCGVGVPKRLNELGVAVDEPRAGEGAGDGRTVGRTGGGDKARGGDEGGDGVHRFGRGMRSIGPAANALWNSPTDDEACPAPRHAVPLTSGSAARTPSRARLSVAAERSARSAALAARAAPTGGGAALLTGVDCVGVEGATERSSAWSRARNEVEVRRGVVPRSAGWRRRRSTRDVRASSSLTFSVAATVMLRSARLTESSDGALQVKEVRGKSALSLREARTTRRAT